VWPLASDNNPVRVGETIPSSSRSIHIALSCCSTRIWARWVMRMRVFCALFVIEIAYLYMRVLIAAVLIGPPIAGALALADWLGG
jgi:hypothetical protein